MRYSDIEYVECDQVYQPAEDTFLLIDNLEVEPNSKVLEIGCGSGIVSIKASKKARSVTAVDINPYAITCTRKNMELNNTTNITLVESDLFDDITDTYDLIIFNTPYLPVDDDEHDESIYTKAWDGGNSGREVIDEFISQAPQYLRENGAIQLVQSSLSDNDKTLERLRQLGLKAEITAEEHIFFEDITLITARQVDHP